MRCPRKLELRPSPGCHVFSGYYDKSPFDFANARHLALQTRVFDRLPERDDVAEVGYFDLATRHFHQLDETNSFNWQQGAMLQWLGPDYNDQIIFNRREGNRFQSRIVDLRTSNCRDISTAVYAVRPQGDLALGLDFARHYWCRRAYSYAGVEDDSKNRRIVPGDGIIAVDLQSGLTKTIITIEQLLAIRPAPSMSGAIHYVEHMMFSRSGSRFMFYHRWKASTGDIFARLYVADVNEPVPKLVLDSGRLSHACWIDDENILAWAAPESKLGSFRKSRFVKGRLGKLLRPLYQAIISGNPKYGQTSLSRRINGDSYLLIKTGDPTASPKPVCVETLDRDGHPSAFQTRHGLIITDTYPDMQHRARLIMANYKTGAMREVDTVTSMATLDNTPFRCDLHPKLSFDETLVSIDTVEAGQRAIYVYDVAPLVAEMS